MTTPTSDTKKFQVDNMDYNTSLQQIRRHQTSGWGTCIMGLFPGEPLQQSRQTTNQEASDIGMPGGHLHYGVVPGEPLQQSRPSKLTLRRSRCRLLLGGPPLASASHHTGNLYIQFGVCCSTKQMQMQILVFQAGYHPRKRTVKTHPKHKFFRYENRPLLNTRFSMHFS